MSTGYIVATMVQYVLIVVGAVLINVGVHKHKYWAAVAGGICWQISGTIGGIK